LILDDLRGLARILGVDDDLRIGEVGNGIERNACDGIEPGERGKRRPDQDEDDVRCRPADQLRDHGAAGAVKVLRAARRLLSASIRKLPDTTTRSPSVTPVRIST